MKNSPNNRAHLKSSVHEGKVGEGLNVNTATFNDCAEAILYLTEGYVKLLTLDDKPTFFGDSATCERINAYFERNYKDEALKPLTPEAKLATIMNRLAKSMDANIPVNSTGILPIKELGIPNRMQALWLIQHEQGVTR